MIKAVEVLRECIVHAVFVKQENERIVPETSNWLMDFRRVCLDPHFLDAYTEAFYEKYHKELPFQVGGMEVAAIPLISAIVMKMREKGTPVNGFFIRKSRKKTGLLKMIEGKLTSDPVILVDDLINSGSTLDRQMVVLDEARVPLKAYFTLLRFRDISNYERFTKRNVGIDSLFTLDDFRESLHTKILTDRGNETVQPFTVEWFFKSNNALLESVIPKSQLVVDEKNVYFGSDSGVIWALNKTDGSIVWQHHIGRKPKRTEVFSSPVIWKGRLYIGAYDGNVYCLDAETGKKVWVTFEADWVHGSPVINKEDKALYIPVIFGLSGRAGGILALDLETGKKIWLKEFPPSFRSTPLFVSSEKKLFVGGEDGTLFAIDARDGACLWTFRSGEAIKDAPVYDQASGNILFSSFDGCIYALESKKGLLAWKNDIGLANYSSPYLWKEKVFVASLDKNLYCLDIHTGEKKWSFPGRARIFSSPRVYENRLYFGGNDARLYELDPLSGKQIGFFQAVERITNPLVYDSLSKKFFLQTYANEVYCLSQKSQTIDK